MRTSRPRSTTLVPFEQWIIVTLKSGVAACAAWNWRGDGSKCHARLVLAEGKNAASEFALYAPYAGTVEVGRRLSVRRV